jgi:hypothetical protein
MKLFRSVLAVTAVATTTLFGTASAQAAAPGTDFTGIAALSNCSASLVRYAESVSTDKALVLTNGHCYEGGFLQPGQVLVNKASTRSITLLKPDSSRAGTVRADKILFGTMTKTDMIVYEVNESYASIKSRLNVTPADPGQAGPGRRCRYGGRVRLLEAHLHLLGAGDDPATARGRLDLAELDQVPAAGLRDDRRHVGITRREHDDRRADRHQQHR